jgi:hypothetical protein
VKFSFERYKGGGATALKMVTVGSAAPAASKAAPAPAGTGRDQENRAREGGQAGRHN